MLAVDTYGTNEAARVLGVSPKRVRQLVAQGTLSALQTNPLRLSQQAVHDLRDLRRKDSRAKSPQPAAAPPADFTALLDRLLDSERRATAAETRAAITAQAVDEMKAERDALASQVAQLQQRLERRRWGRKG